MNLRVNNLGLLNLSSTTKAIARSLERLSTGQRINRPSDDPSAYALSVRLESQVRGLSTYARSLNQSIAMVETTHSALQAQMDIVQRMRELAVRAASSTLSGVERGAIQTELTNLEGEFRRITQETEFNGHRLLDGSFAGFNLKASASDDGIDFNLPSSTFNQIFAETAGTGSFSFSNTFDAAAATQDTKTGDFNGDGLEDMATIESGSIRVFFGNGAGGFSSQITFAAGSEGQLIVADVNNDGKDDILASSAADTLRSYTFSNGSFSAIGTISTPASGLPYDVSVGDVNHDGNIDVAVAGSDNVSIFLGDGSGGFTASSSYSMNSARSVELADFNGDGKLDFVTANLSSNQILVYLGNGLGQFSSHSTFTTAGGPIAMTAGDVNDDGLADIAVAYGTSNQVVVFENNGDAIFSAVQTFTEGSGASIENVDFVDLDEDGYLDLIYNVANQGVGIYYGNGAAQFVGRQSTTVNGFGELTEFKVLSGGSTFVPGSYVSVFNPAGSGFGFWFRVDGVGTQPFLPYINWGVDLSSGDSASSVASKLASAMATRISSDFEVTRDGTNIYVTSRAIGNTPDAITTAARISSSVTDGEADRSFSGIQISSISGLNSYAILDLDQDGDLDVVANNSVAKAWVYLQDSLTAPRSFSVQKPKEAGRLITTLDKAIERLKERQVSLDVLQSRLRISMDASLLLADTYEEARLSVASADLGVEVADLIVNQIRQQAAMAAQVQQNLSQKIILSLLL